MDKAHKLNYWLIASILGLNLLLQGCSTIISKLMIRCTSYLLKYY